ncbi:MULTISPECIES: OmpA family protein [Luteimonas]|uniref:OmpA family protein n=1 Tax=Luteimonas TaxID=83614 RepID=UPI000C7AE4F1|nr:MULTISPECIES: OmpA family protein [Luteimonas]
MLAAGLAVLIAGCAQPSDAPAEVLPGDAPVERAAPAEGDADDSASVDAPVQDADRDAAPAGFNIDALPLSTQVLGEFPFFSIPEGYGEAFNSTRRLDFGEAAFWTGSGVHRVEGRVYATGIGVDRDQSKDKQFSDLEVVRNLERVVTAAGGVEVFAGQSPREVGDEISRVMKQYRTEANCYGFSPEQIFVLRRDDGNVWVRTCRAGNFAGLIVVQEQALQVTSTLLPASALEQALTDTGRVALQVHFATDRAEILADSQPQIVQVVELLQADDALALSIEGHTDNTGDPVRNRTLSQARAASVVAALTEAGIASDRLDAVGHGDSRPVADNADETGRAANRRVELVRRP